MIDEFKIRLLLQSAIQRIVFEQEIIDFNPPYQRSGNIWRLENKQLLIDSIINNYDIPKLYFHELKNPTDKIKYRIIDGKQRLEAILEFMNDKFRLSSDFVYFENPSLDAKGLSYSSLGNKYPNLQIRFDSFSLPIVCVETDNLDYIEDMFSRLNDAVPLNAAEKRNALGGPMVKTIKDMISDDFFQKKINIKNRRGKYDDLAAKLLFLEECLIRDGRIHDTKKILLDTMVKNHKTSPLEKTQKIGCKVKFIFQKMNRVFQDKDPLLNSPTTIPVYFLLFRKTIEENKINCITRSKLFQFRKEVQQNRTIAEDDISQANYDLLEYHNMSNQGTNDAGSMKERLRIVSEYVLK